MPRITNSHSSSAPPYKLDDMLTQASQLLNVLATLAAKSQATIQGFVDAEKMIAALPLAADQFALAKRRLGNAVGYYRGMEIGAACYELRLIARSLQP